jgi:sulfonate transport system substrate-binding protein
LATAADTPIMFAIMGGKKITILAVIQSGNKNEAIIARKDRGIMKPDDFTGKKIGLALGSKSHFFTEAFLTAHGINKKQVKIINMNPDEMADALATGKVDAVSTWNPTLAQLIKQLGNNGHVFYGENFYAENFCVAAQHQYVKNNPEAIKKFLRALLKAETFVQQHPEEAKRIAAKFTKADKAILDETWDIFNYKVSLDQVLLVNLEDETRWAIKNRLTSRRDMPNYLDYIYVDGLSAVRPAAVRIIR